MTSTEARTRFLVAQEPDTPDLKVRAQTDVVQTGHLDRMVMWSR